MNAEKLFGDFSDIDKLRPSLLPGIKNYRLVENVAISFEYDRLPVAFGFSISESTDFSIHSRGGSKERAAC